MMIGGGHVFIVRGDLRKLAVDAWLLPTDRWLNITSAWADTAPDLRAFALPEAWGDGDLRVVEVPGTSPRCWLGNVGRVGVPPEWYGEAARQFIRGASVATSASATAPRRSRLLLGLPLVGTGFGGGAPLSGEVAESLVRAVAEESSRNGVDCCIVCWTNAGYAAVQRARKCLLESDPLSAAGWADVDPAALSAADRLGERALNGSLVLFIGAGLSVAAGLLAWSGLLDKLAGVAGMDPGQREALLQLPEVDRARVIEGRLSALGQSLDDRIRDLVTGERYSLSHALVAGLPTNEIVTTNYDELFEQASRAAGCKVVVLPWEAARPQTRWLLKMHGCARRGDIVLTRDDYHRYEQTRAALAGIVQALLITRHMLFVGFSMTDPNFVRIVEDVRQAIRRDPAAPTQSFGTAVMLYDSPMMKELWREDIGLLGLSPADTPAPVAARTVEMFLDRLAFVATDATAHLLAPNFEGILTEPERWLSNALRELERSRPGGLDETGAWAAVDELLRRLGRPSRA